MKKTEDIQKAELERKKRDLYRVYNPTNQDYQVMLNIKISPEVWTIKAKSEEILPAYAANKYLNEMANKIIYNKSDKAIIEENEKRITKGFSKMDLHTEQARFEGRNLKNLMSKKNKIIAILNRGLYKEYGVGDQKVQEIAKEEQRKTFDPGLDLDKEEILTKKETVEETPEEKAERLKKSRLENLARAREAKKNKS